MFGSTDPVTQSASYKQILGTGRVTGETFGCWIFFLDLTVLNLTVKPNVYYYGFLCYFQAFGEFFP